MKTLDCVAHLGFTQTHPTSPRPADDLGRAIVVRLGFSQRSQGESELGRRVQMRPEDEAFISKTTPEVFSDVFLR